MLHVFALEQKQRHFGLNLKDFVTENPAEAEAASSDDASDKFSDGASSLKVCEQEKEQSGEEEVSSMLRLHVNAHIALSYRSLSTFGASGAKILGYKSFHDNPDPGEVSMALLVSCKGLVSYWSPPVDH